MFGQCRRHLFCVKLIVAQLVTMLGKTEKIAEGVDETKRQQMETLLRRHLVLCGTFL